MAWWSVYVASMRTVSEWEANLHSAGIGLAGRRDLLYKPRAAVTDGRDRFTEI